MYIGARLSVYRVSVACGALVLRLYIHHTSRKARRRGALDSRGSIPRAYVSLQRSPGERADDARLHATDRRKLCAPRLARASLCFPRRFFPLCRARFPRFRLRLLPPPPFIFGACSHFGLADRVAFFVWISEVGGWRDWILTVFC